MNKQCPNIDCKSSNFIKDGSFRRKSDCRVIQRFRCKACGQRFSNASFALEKHQNKRTINYMVLNLLCSGVSMKRAARVLRVDKKTIDRKLVFLSKKAKLVNAKTLENLKNKINHIQIDDLITSEHTKMKPITVSVATDVDTRQILSIKTGSIPAFGHLSKPSKLKYGKRKSEHKKALTELFEDIRPVLKNCNYIDSDEHKFYPEFIQKYVPNAVHSTHKSRRGHTWGQGEVKLGPNDPLFYINHTFGMMRDGIKRLARRTWCNTKKIEHLQMHLDIYRWYHNEIYLNTG